MGNNLSPYSIAVGHENISFLPPHFKFIKRKKIIDDEILKTNENSVDPFRYHISNCGDDLFEKLQICEIHSNYDN